MKPHRIIALLVVTVSSVAAVPIIAVLFQSQLGTDSECVDVMQKLSILGARIGISNQRQSEEHEPCDSVDSLDVSGTSVQDDDLNGISRFTSIRRLHVHDTSLSDGLAVSIRRLANLKTLSMQNCKRTGRFFTYCPELLGRLEFLSITECTHEMTFDMIGGSRISSLVLDECVLTKSRAEALAEMDMLKCLKLNNCYFEDGSIKVISECARLNVLSFNRCAVNFDDLDEPTIFSGVRGVYLKDCIVISVQSLARLHQLDEIEFVRCQFANEGFELLTKTFESEGRFVRVVVNTH